MRPEDPLKDIVTNEIDYNTLVFSLRAYQFPRNKIGSLLKSGRLIRVKKGIYVKAGSGFSPPVLANMVYGPSYVSLDYALSLYGMIPERVHTVTSVTLGRTKRFDTPVGTFLYEPLPTRFFSLGVRRVELTFTQAYLIGAPEKCLVDLVWKRRDLATLKALEEFLVDDRRIDLTQDHLFSMARMRALEAAYKRPVVTALAKILAERTRK